MKMASGLLLLAVVTTVEGVITTGESQPPLAAGHLRSPSLSLVQQAGKAMEASSEQKPAPKLANANKENVFTLRSQNAAGKAYTPMPWDATFAIDLGASAYVYTPSGPQRQVNFTVRVHPEWAPEGAKRFEEILHLGILSGTRFFRVVPDFMVQFGIPGNPQVAKEWGVKTIEDDPVKHSNTRGTMTFATAGPGTRTTQMFINFADNSVLDSDGFAPFAEVIGSGMQAVDRIQAKYGEEPDQDRIIYEGNDYLASHFPDLSFVRCIAGSASSDASSVAATCQELKKNGALHLALGPASLAIVSLSMLSQWL